MKSNYRMADLIVRLMNGEVLKQADIQEKYGVSLRTSQRDIANVRSALAEYDAGDVVEEGGAYRLSRRSELPDFEMALATSNILLGTRALAPAELEATLDFLSSGLSPRMREKVSQHLRFPKGSYIPLSKPTLLLERLKEIASAIANNKKLIFKYLSSQPSEPEPLIHHAQPITIFFEMHYFYIAMLSEERNGYWLYRLDRITEIVKEVDGKKLTYEERFSLQDHRRQTYLVDSGDLTRIRFIYRNYVQTALDFFPESRVIKQNDDGSVVIEAYVKIDGAMMWLLGQGYGVKVISPVSLVERMKRELNQTRNQYPD